MRRQRIGRKSRRSLAPNRSLTPSVWDVLLALLVSLTAAAGDGKRLNVVFITLDTLRLDHMGAYGYERPTSPAMDQLAAEGVVFERCVAASNWTIPCQMTMFTGLHPSRHQAITIKHKLGEGLTTLAAEFRKAGYATAGITSNVSTTGKFGFARGFKHYDDYTVFMASDLNLFDQRSEALDFYQTTTSETVNRMALKWLDRRRDKEQPFFLHLFYFDPHYEYVPPPKYKKMFVDPDYAGAQNGRLIWELRGEKGKDLTAADKQHLQDLYDGDIRYTDDHIGAIVAELKRRGLYDQTIILIVGDHGDEFWDHGSCAHGHTLYDELVRMPLIIRWPGSVKPDTRIKQQVSHLDVMSTVLGMAGLPIPEQCEGRNLAPLLQGKTVDDAPAFMEGDADRKVWGVSTAAKKIIRYRDTNELLMFDLVQDPGEQTNLAGTERAADFAELLAKLERWQKRMTEARKQIPDPAKKVDPKLRKRLKALGYVH